MEKNGKIWDNGKKKFRSSEKENERKVKDLRNGYTVAKMTPCDFMQYINIFASYSNVNNEQSITNTWAERATSS